MESSTATLVLNGIKELQGLLIEEHPDLLVPEGFPDSVTISRLSSYVELIQKWSPRVDLVSPCSLQTLVEKHLLDSVAVSLLLTAKLQIDPTDQYLDIGSGAGFPGMVLAIVEPTRGISLCEPREKRTIFLKEVKRELKLENVEILCSRVEEISKSREFLYGLMIQRALGNDTVFFDHSLRLLKKRGYAVQMVSSQWKNDHAEKESLQIADVYQYSLPQLIERRLATWQKKNFTQTFS